MKNNLDINGDEILVGFKTYRHESDPKEKELHDKFVKKFVAPNGNNFEILEKIIFGCSNDSQTIPNDYLSDREKRISISLIQWLGSCVGQSFLRDCGFELVDKK